MKVTTKQVVDLLNELLQTDPDAINALFNNRVICNQTIIDHPTVQIFQGKVGLLGILNGLFYRTDGKGVRGAIAALYEAVCPTGCPTPPGSTIHDKCAECSTQLMLGKISNFIVMGE